MMLKKAYRLFSKDNFPAQLFILFGVLIWSLVMIRSGLCWNANCIGGLGFWGANGHDGIWHIALIRSLSHMSYQIPIFSGWNLQNYHIGFDLLLSWFVRFFKISPLLLYFQIAPPLISLAIGLLTYKFVYLWRKSAAESLLAMFFIYFGGSFGWIVSLIRGKGWGGESMFWSQQSISTLINPPFALSLVTVLLGLIFLLNYLKKKTILNYFLTSFFLGVTIFIKVYAGLLVIVSIFTASLWHAFRKKDLSVFWVFLSTLTISAMLFIPFNRSSVNLVSFAPFWFLESMMALSDRVGWQRFYSAMTTYRMGHIWIKAVAAYLVAFGIFFVGNFGTRIIALIPLLKKYKRVLSVGPLEIFICTIILAGMAVPMLFVQKGTPWNTIQFLYYSLMFSGIIAGIAFWQWIQKRRAVTRAVLLGILVLFTIPTTIASLGNYLPQKPQSNLPIEEVEALTFLRNQPDGIVLTYPYTKTPSNQTPKPLYLYESTAYVSAFSGKNVFLEDEINLDIMQYPWQERKQSVLDFLNTLDEEEARRFLSDNNITYIYWLKDQHARIGDKQLGLTKIYEKDGVSIFKVN